MKSSLAPATDSEKKRWSRMRELGCIACRISGIRTGLPLEIHHFLSGGRRIGHSATVCLCSHHHRSNSGHMMLGNKQMTAMYGPSLANGSKPFRAVYGTDGDLLHYQNQLLEGPQCS